MSTTTLPVRVAFPGFDPSKATIPLAAALGIGAHPESIAGAERFRGLAAMADRCLEPVDPKEGQVLIYPHAFEEGAGAALVSRLSADLGVPALFFMPSETLRPTSVERGLVYRSSSERSKAGPHERVMPALVPDVMRELATVSLPWTALTWTDVPRVGFCGYTGFSLGRLAFRLMGKAEKARGLEIRVRATRILLASENVETSFVLRKQFWGGAKSPVRPFRAGGRAIRRTFLENMVSSAYNLAPRGKGNYSFRFYEALACGRIPILIDTDCELPFPDRIDWKEHVVWVEADDCERMDEVLMDFHERHRGPAFVRLQHRNRQLWERWLRPESFFFQVIRDAVGRTDPISDGPRLGVPA